LECFAFLAIAQGDYKQAALLLGAARNIFLQDGKIYALPAGASQAGPVTGAGLVVKG